MGRSDTLRYFLAIWAGLAHITNCGPCRGHWAHVVARHGL
ncbi:hypothetical protein Zm00014a_024740 [Zea mays]|uniref:Uncharacterized protein n=1 Tax=Zea mays TaxID=4577 RepID=A0A3L6FCS3_MAIZE|nr:hypothetical protein Zm00014a_024740 [Zea mays]